MSITAAVENDTIKLPVHVPDGTKVTVTLPEDGSFCAESEFDRLKRQEREIRESITAFRGADRLSRDEVHDRNALR
jgi:hypothetical protein